jgi:secreted trypsin-like serine protease
MFTQIVTILLLAATALGKDFFLLFEAIFFLNLSRHSGSPIGGRIVNGTDAQDGDFPSIVSTKKYILNKTNWHILI